LADLGAEARPAVPALVQVLSDQSPVVRRWAIFALGEVGPTAPAAIPALIESFAVDDVRTRSVASAALAKMGPRALPRLIDALRHADPRVRRGAALTLGKSPRAREAADDLLGLLRDDDPLVREAAVDVLQRILPEE